MMPSMHTPTRKKVKDVVDTGKEFNASGGSVRKRKYLVHFMDGYVAEFCPPVDQRPAFGPGSTIIFQVTFRNGQGDTIEVSMIEGEGTANLPAVQNQPQQNGNPVNNCSMMGHPAAIALANATNLGIASGKDKKEILEDAEDMMKWLLERKDIDQYTF